MGIAKAVSFLVMFLTATAVMASDSRFDDLKGNPDLRSASAAGQGEEVAAS